MRTSEGSVRAIRSYPPAILLFLLSAVGSPLWAGEAGPAKPGVKPTVKLQAKSIIFNQKQGDILLEGDVHVTRTVSGGVMVIDCDKMTAKLTDGKLGDVLATGNVKLSTKDLKATASRADLAFAQSKITLYGAPGKPAVARLAGIVAQGPKIIFDTSTGDISLEGSARVIRTTDESKMTVDCDKMTAKLAEGKLTNALATGNVGLAAKDLSATASKAAFDFTKNVITLYGVKDKSAVAKSAGVISRGPRIIFHLDDQRVVLPDGGTSEIDLKSGGDKKNAG